MNPEFSVVIPIYNEEESLQELIARITESFRKFGKKYEIIFIDDGSTDTTLDLLKKYSRDNKNVRVFSFRRNLGKSPALTLGFQMAKGKFILTMDADLQDDPENIGTLFKTMNKGGFDLVSGWRKNRRDTFLKIISSRFFNNFIIPIMFGLKLHDLNCGLKLYKKELSDDLALYGGMHRFVPVLAHEKGFKVAEVPIVHHSRKYGYSKYKPTKIFTDIPDLITMYFLTKYTRRPLHFFSKLGGILLLIGTVILVYLVIIKLMGNSIGSRPLLTFGVLFEIAGLQTIFTGLLADLIVNMNKEDKVNFPIKYSSS